jgi:hypothetical protein
VEHFLIEHHQDLREFGTRTILAHEKNALRSAGLLFVRDDGLRFLTSRPYDLADVGIDMGPDSARRLFGHRAAELAGARGLDPHVRTKETARANTGENQPRGVARCRFTLKDICRETDASASGNKDELIERIIGISRNGRTSGRRSRSSHPDTSRGALTRSTSRLCSVCYFTRSFRTSFAGFLICGRRAPRRPEYERCGRHISRRRLF